jgi:hypothetical protein
MLNNGSRLWAQIGPAVFNDSTRHTLEQCANLDDPNNPITDLIQGPQAIGTSPTYQAIYNGSSYNFYVNGGAEGPGCTRSFSPVTAEASGEIANRRDQLPGETGNHEGFHNVQVKHADGTVEDLLVAGGYSGLPFPLLSWEGDFKAGSDHLETWDGDC